jgi:hypothetical protein
VFRFAFWLLLATPWPEIFRFYLSILGDLDMEVTTSVSLVVLLLNDLNETHVTIGCRS